MHPIKLVKHKNFYIQTILAIIYITLALAAMSYFSTNKIAWSLGIGAITATIYLVFTLPESKVAKPQNIIGGYIIGIGTGVLVHFILIKLFHNTQTISLEIQRFEYFLASSLSIGLAIIFMNFFNLTHPPAVAASMVLTIGLKDYKTILILLMFAVILGISKHFLKNFLINLS